MKKKHMVVTGMMIRADWQPLVPVDKTLLLCLHLVFFSIILPPVLPSPLSAPSILTQTADVGVSAV